MSGYLWRYYFQDDVDQFRHVLATTTQPHKSTQKSLAGLQGTTNPQPLNSSPGSYGNSSAASLKSRKYGPNTSAYLSRSDINSRDAVGLTILHHAASSTSGNALAFAQALLEHPWTDVYIQDAENGWTPLHRAFYFGNIAVARLILNRDVQDILGHRTGSFNQHACGLVKIKDKEGYGPLDLFSMTIKDRTLRPDTHLFKDSDSDDEVAYGVSIDADAESRRRVVAPSIQLDGDELYTFGSNKNVTLGFGDEDDRQFPERITLRRPDHLLQRFYREHCEKQNQVWMGMAHARPDPRSLQAKSIVDLPTHIRNTPMVMQDIQMSKLHTAVLTTDSCSNLYMCGHGPGGRLGTGDESTRYQFTCIQGGGLGSKRVVAIALGQNHTLAVSDEGGIFSWGNNAFGQLGYALPKPALKDDDPISTIPRQIFGPLKREIIVGIAASRIHSVVHTSTSLYTFGKNGGQLGIVDSEARSLDMQVVPRKIAASLFSSPIYSVSAIDNATICLLENREVWVFANYGYSKLSFPLEGFTSSFLKESWLTTKYETAPNKIRKITSGGETICALTTSGDVFTVTVSQRRDNSLDATTSTTNPKQIREALSMPYRMWSSKKNHMAARDVDVDQDGSIVLTTEAGSVWKRTKRATIQNASHISAKESKPKDYKFQRVPGLTRVVAVRASAFGAYAAIRKDCNVTKTEIGVDEPKLWEDLAPLLSFYELTNYEETSDDEDPTPRFWIKATPSQGLRKRVLRSKDLEVEIDTILQRLATTTQNSYDLEVGTTLSNIRIPVHQAILTGRSPIFRDAIGEYRAKGTTGSISDLLEIRENQGKLTVMLQGLDFLTIFNLVLYAYTDTLVDFWNVARHYPTLAFRYRTIRTELMKVASRLDMRQLEPAVRQMIDPRKSLHLDMRMASADRRFFESGDLIVELANGEMLLHTDILCQRCPFFDGLFRGRAGGQWLAERRMEESSLVRIDLTHIEVHLFELIVRHIYTDVGEEMFDDVTSQDLNDLLALDELLDHVMDVMSVANELMLDRLSQMCQRLIGRYVNARNVCSLLAAIAPSSVAEFKDATLEYICMNIEAVMQNGNLDELDQDLLVELNQVVHENQLAYLPFARSGRAETLLFDRYPELVERIENGKRAKVDNIVMSNKHANCEILSASFRAQSLEEVVMSPLRQRNRRRASKESKSPALRPTLIGQQSTQDLMFDMSDEEGEDERTAKRQAPPSAEQENHPQAIHTPPGSPYAPWTPVHRQRRSSSHNALLSSMNSPPPLHFKDSRSLEQPWGNALLPSVKLDLKDIMAQASSTTKSNLTLGLSRAGHERSMKLAHAKISQKERKRLQQAQSLGAKVEQLVPLPPTVSPWQASLPHKSSTSTTQAAILPVHPLPTPQIRASSTPQLTMRQTIARKGNTPKEQEKSSQGGFPKAASHSAASPQVHPGPNDRGMSISTNPIPTPRSVRHIPLPQHSPTSPSQHLSMMEILSIQEAEKSMMRDAGQKRSLQEIQQEQEFQQWWDQESRRVMEEEKSTKRLVERAARGRVGRGVRGSRGKGKGKEQGKASDKESSEEKSAIKSDASGTNAKAKANANRGRGNQDVNESAEQSVQPGKGGGRRGARGVARGGRGRIGGTTRDNARAEETAESSGPVITS